MTRGEALAIVRGFREYPGRAVSKLEWRDGRAVAPCADKIHGLRYTGYKRFTTGFDLWPIAIVPATPSSWMGYAGRNSETESARRNTAKALDHRRLLFTEVAVLKSEAGVAACLRQEHARVLRVAR